MLVLAVKEGEAVQIGDNVRITVLKDKKDSLKLSIEAPREIEIQRGGRMEKMEQTGQD